MERSEHCRTIAIQLELKETVDGLQLLIIDEDGIESETTVKVEKAVARQAGMITDMAEKQLRKSGGSVFSIGDVRVDLRPETFFSRSGFQ